MLYVYSAPGMLGAIQPIAVDIAAATESLQTCWVLPCFLLQDLLDMVRSEVRLWRVSLPAPVLLVACGAHHTLAALATGGVVAWGRNNRGQVRAW